MRLFESESMEIFKTEGIPVPRAEIVSSAEEARRTALSLGMPVILKAQVLVGGRAKAGGILVAEDPNEVARSAQEILEMQIEGLKVDKLLVEEYLPVARELFISVAIDDSKGKFVILASSQGGIEIEEIASKFPEDDIQIHICSTLISELAEEFSNVKYVKVEGSLSIMKISELRELTSGKIGIFGGDGGLRMIQEFGVGAKGFIPGAAMSELSVEVFQNLEKGDIEKAKEKHDKLLIFLRFCSSHALSWIKVEKEALKMLGVIDSSYVRQPSVPLPPVYQQEIKGILNGLGLASKPT